MQQKSFRSYDWVLPKRLSSPTPETVLESVLDGRAIEDQQSFLNPAISRAMPDVFWFEDMRKAAERMVGAITRGESIGIWGDYDADGVTSTSILTRFLRLLGVEPTRYIPDREAEGYGPNALGMVNLANSGVKLVATLDCGTVAIEPIKAAHDAGMDVVVIDHHAARPDGLLPDAVAVVNPNRIGHPPGYGYLAACGMTFIFCTAISRVLREQGYFSGWTEPQIQDLKRGLMNLTDLVAIGTVADVVPLVGLNRAFVSTGLKVMAKMGNMGIDALLQVSNFKKEPDAECCGFVLGPRINAAGRIAHAMVAVDLLISDDWETCWSLARELDAHNTKRKTIEAQCTAEALRQIEDAGGPGEVIVAAGEGWHPGVIGITAGQLKEQFDRPVFVIGLDGSPGLESTEGKGSGRSIDGFDLGHCVHDALDKGILMKGGGHGKAAGLTIRGDKLEAFRAHFEQSFREQTAAGLDRSLILEALLDLQNISVELVGALRSLSPFGEANREPLIAIDDVCLEAVRVAGKDQKTYLLDFSSGEHTLRGVLFRAPGTKLGDGLLAAVGCRMQICGRLNLNTYNDRTSVQIMIVDARIIDAAEQSAAPTEQAESFINWAMDKSAPLFA